VLNVYGAQEYRPAGESRDLFVTTIVIAGYVAAPSEIYGFAK
jgi:hypothetical protein